MAGLFHRVANYMAAALMRGLFSTVGRIHVLHRQNTDRPGSYLLVANHISHFDPFIISAVVRRKIDWMAMAEFFSNRSLRLLLSAVDAFAAERDRADLVTIRTALSRLRNGRVVGLFPEGGIRDGARSVLNGAPLRPGATRLAWMAKVPIVPCVLLGSDRFYAKKSWLPFRRVPVWVAFGQPILPNQSEDKSTDRMGLQRQLASAFEHLYAELRDHFMLEPEDLPHPPRIRMANEKAGMPGPAQHRVLLPLRRAWASIVDGAMCASMNLLQSRHRLSASSRSDMENYVSTGEQLTVQQYYATPAENPLTDLIGNNTSVSWRGSIETSFPQNDIAHADFFLSGEGYSAPTVVMLHALMSVRDNGYRRCAAQFNELGWNACFVHLPYHYSRVPTGYRNGELAITANLIRNAEALRQAVVELRQLLAALRARGCGTLGVLATSYGAWIGALLAVVESSFRFVALMAPIVNVDHAIWENPGSRFMRRELARADIDRALVTRHFRLTSPLHNQPLCGADRVLLVAGDFDSIARPVDIEKLHQSWRGSELLRVAQGHFGYRMMRDTIARLKQRGDLEP